MKLKNIFRGISAILASGAFLAGCTTNEFDEITEMSLSRCLEPQNLSAKVDVNTGDHITFGWNVNKDAETYNLVVCSDEELSAEELNVTIGADEVPYTVRLTADKQYWFKVQALSESRGASNWAVYDGSCKTYAVKDNLFLEITGRESNSISLSWSKEVSDYTEVTHISATPVKGGEPVKLELGAEEAAAAAATISGLEASTEYQLTLFYMSASRGSVDAWTKANPGSATRVSTSEELIALMTAGDNIYLTQAGSPYSIDVAKPAGSISVVGEIGADGSKPVVVGKIELTAAFPATEGSVYLEGVKFDGGATNSRVIEHTSGALDIASIKLVNCEITNYLAGLFYQNSGDLIKVGDFTFDSCDIYANLGSGGDAFDVRKASEYTKIAFVNNTIYEGIRTMFRIDANDNIKIGSFIFTNNTVKNIATIDDGNNRGFFAFRVASEMTLKKNLFLHEDGGKTAAEETDKAQLFQDNAATVVPTLTAADNYAFGCGKDFFKKVDAATAGFKVLTADPCYNSKGNFFQLSNQDLISAGIGASKWWIPYVEKEEDLTQNVLEGAHTWNLQDATLFAGEIKNSRVRDYLMLVGTEATPLRADAGIEFPDASQLTKKGVPTAGYASFKVNTAGSVDLQVEGSGSGSVMIAVFDDNGLSVKGGAIPASTGSSVQKVIVDEVAGEATIYLYSTGAVKLTKLAWSLDNKGGNKVLATPKPSVEPVTLTEGDETAVTVTWDAVANAASYIVVFNKKAQPAQTELSYTVAAEDIAELKAGLYNFTVQAMPAEEDIYYTKSELGLASVAIQPKSAGGVEETHTLTWDFSAADWQAEFAKYGAANSDITNWNLTYDGLTIVSTAKSKYNTTYFQWGGKGNLDDRHMTFTAPEQGTLKVWASNTGSSNDASRNVAVNQDGEVTLLVGGTPSNADPSVCEFSVKAGQVYIYADGNALRFYKIEFTYTTVSGGAPAPIEYDWDFSAADWQAEFAKYGAANSDITNWNLTYDGLTIVSTAKSKYNTTYFQWGGKGNLDDRHMTFTAPDQGTLTVWASNTGSSNDASRNVAVNQDGEVTLLVGGTPSNADLSVCEFSVKAGQVYIYADGNALRFYRIHYSNQ